MAAVIGNAFDSLADQLPDLRECRLLNSFARSLPRPLGCDRSELKATVRTRG